MRRLFALCFVCCVFAACTGGLGADSTVYSAFRPIDPDGWRYTDTLAFPLAAMTDSGVCRGDVVVTVRHSNDYPYSNLWIEIVTPQGAQSRSMELADVYGRWYGRGMGLTFECTDTLLRDVALAPSDTLLLHHNMRVDTLPAIEQIGVFFVRKPNDL